MAYRRTVVGASLWLVLVVALGLAAGMWDTSARLPEVAPETLAGVSISIPTVLMAGLADGINPCAFTVLLLFVAAVTTAYRDVDGASVPATRARLLVVGGAFITAIFATYLALGAGLLGTATTLTQDHLGTRLGALAAVFLGLWMLKDGLAPGWGPRLGAPAVVGDLVRRWGQRATVAGMLGIGVLVALCTVPCSGAVYLGVVSLLALQDSFVRGYLYLVLYNVAFIMPLVGILVAASTRPGLNRLARWNLHHREWVRIGLGAGVVVLGLAILAAV